MYKLIVLMNPVAPTQDITLCKDGVVEYVYQVPLKDFQNQMNKLMSSHDIEEVIIKGNKEFAQHYIKGAINYSSTRIEFI